MTVQFIRQTTMAANIVKQVGDVEKYTAITEATLIAMGDAVNYTGPIVPSVDTVVVNELNQPVSAMSAAQVSTLAGVPATRNTIAIFGDSITAQCSSNTATAKYISDNGYIGYAMMLSRGNLSFNLAHNFGVGGDTTTLMLARIADVIASGVRFCVVAAGTNDIVASGASPATVTANLQSIYSQLIQAGITPIAVPIFPRSNDGSGGLLSVANRRKIYSVNQWIRNYTATNSGVLLADATENIVDYAATGANIGDPIGGNSAAVTSYTYDGLHLNKRGAYYVGKAIVAALTAAGVLQSTRNTILLNPIDTYHVTDNPTGNLLTNGNFIGTGGALAGSATGVVANDWTLQRNSGTVVGSKGTITLDNGTTTEAQIATFTGASQCKLYVQVYSPAYLTIGDQVYLEAEYEFTGTNLMQCYARVTDGTVIADTLRNSGDFYMPGSISGVLRTYPFALTSISAVNAEFNARSAGDAVFKVSRAAWRKVIPSA